ncbi:testis-expressed protein 10-like [Cajanus cajan]|uniref:testis-expressed protein 10-like n=1 Tax=Cajanus cajan TaxID=3821 RepID=UPI0010FB2475|nr:testis-expressed protein 10-like [Cajanus cajan]
MCKLILVYLAGSERAKRTSADGMRLKEEQSVATEKAGLAVNKKGLTLKELLQQTSHHNAKVHRDALIGIKDLFIRYPEEQRLHKYTAIEKLRERIGDDDKVVRKSLYDLFKVVILPGCKEDYDLVKSYVSKIQEMEGELQRLKNSNEKSRHFVD